MEPAGTARSSATAAEVLNFYRHCDIAARLLVEVPGNAVTKSHTGMAVRKATLCWTGAKGIVQASARAHAQRAASGKAWSACGFVREHVIPVSTVHREVVRALEVAPDDDLRGGWRAINEDMAAHGVSAAAIRGHQMHHQSIHVVRAVRAWTELAWVTREDHNELKGAGLGVSMPSSWDRVDRHARYRACGLELLPIRPSQR